MHKLLIAGFAGAAIVAAALGGYRLGAGTWPEPVTWLANMAQGPIHANVPRTLEALDAHAPLDHREGWGLIRLGSLWPRSIVMSSSTLMQSTRPLATAAVRAIRTG